MADDSKFGIEVEVDTKGATKKLDDLNKKAEQTNKTLNEKKELRLEGAAAVLGLEHIDDELQKINKSLDSVEGKTSKAFDVGKLVIWYEVLKKIGQAAMAVANYVLDAAKEMTVLNNTAQGLSLSTNTLKAWETTFKTMGFDAKEADAALSSIQDTLTGQLLNPSTQVASAFSMMGINLRKANGEMEDADTILKKMVTTFKTLKPEYALAYGAQARLPRNLIMQMRNNPNFLKTLEEQKNNPVVTEKEVSASRKTTEEAAKLSANVEKARNEALAPVNAILSDSIIPLLTNIADNVASIAGSTVKGMVDFATHPADMTKRAIAPGVGASYQAGGMMKELAEIGAKKGMTSAQISTMMQIGQLESGLRDIPGTSSESSAKGVFQIIDKTWRSLEGNKPRTLENQVDALMKLHKEFEGVANQYGVDPNNALQYRAFHNLGQKNYKIALEMQKQNPQLTYGDVYNATDPSGKTYANNAGLAKQRFPSTLGDEAFKSRNVSPAATTSMVPYNTTAAVAPTASESTAVTNNVIHNNQSSSVNSSTHIGAVNVSANNPEQFANQLSNYKYLDRINNMTGRLA